MDAEKHEADFQAAKKLAESLGYHFDSDYEFDEWLAEISEYYAANGIDVPGWVRCPPSAAAK